jgi:hypothetical protein
VANCDVTPSQKTSQSADAKQNEAKTDARFFTAVMALGVFFVIALKGLHSIEQDQDPHVLFGLSLSSCVAVIALTAALWTGDKTDRIAATLLLLVALPIAVLSVADLSSATRGFPTGRITIAFQNPTQLLFWSLIAVAALLRRKRNFIRPNAQRLR